mmetsp:Transcript_14589/g.46854  ORF Transcript_14589/g.46854 Transcript_14589/m.46854 type:complete len:388 (-) Transcript_14589:28-1191(-)
MSRSDGGPSAYQAAMAREQARLDAARKRSLHEASVHGEAHDDVESAWDSVFNAQKSEVGPSEAEAARARKLARKTEKRKEKAANQAANAANWSVYVCGIPTEVSHTAVQNLFSKAGEVKRVKLYKDGRGENKGDGIVTFASGGAVKAALEPGREWALFGEHLSVAPATFDDKPKVAESDWGRIAVVCGMFTQEQLSTSTDAKEMIRGIEEEAWLECARHGRIERVQCFAADAACPVVLRFEASSAAAACVDSMNGRYYDERQLEATLYDGHRKRVMPDDVDIERSVRLGAVVAERRAEQEREAAAVAAAARGARSRRLLLHLLTAPSDLRPSALVEEEEHRLDHRVAACNLPCDTSLALVQQRRADERVDGGKRAPGKGLVGLGTVG